jgi:hypothetical protein
MIEKYREIKAQEDKIVKYITNLNKKLRASDVALELNRLKVELRRLRKELDEIFGGTNGGAEEVQVAKEPEIKAGRASKKTKQKN